MAAVKTVSKPNPPAYQYCEWRWEEYIDRPVISEQPPVTGQIDWSKEELVSLPVNTAGISLQVRTWDCAERTITMPGVFEDKRSFYLQSLTLKKFPLF